MATNASPKFKAKFTLFLEVSVTGNCRKVKSKYIFYYLWTFEKVTSVLSKFNDEMDIKKINKVHIY